MNDDKSAANFAESDDDSAMKRAARLVNDRKPTTAASSTSWVDWDGEREFLGKPWDSNHIPLSKLEQMRRDPILAFALMFVKVPLIRAPWYIKSSDPRIAAAVDASLRKIYGRFVLAYTNSFDYGFSPMVKRFKYEDKPDWTYVEKDNALGEEQPVWTDKVVKPIVWKPFTALNPRSCKPHWNSKGEFNGIDFSRRGLMSPFFSSGYPGIGSQNWNGGSKRIPDVPLDWALWATNEKDSSFGNYFGYPRIGYAYRFWWAYWYRFGVADRAFEKWGDPPVVIHHPNDMLDVDAEGNKINYTMEALALAESLRSGANVAMPSDVVERLDGSSTNVRKWAAEQMEVKTDFSSINEQFEYLDVQKLRSVMVPEQALVEGKGGTSSRNVAATFGDLFAESQAVVKEEIDDHLNRFIIPQFVEQNFGPAAARAEIVTTGFDSADVDTMKEVVRLIGQRKILSMIDEREILERLNLPTVSRTEMNRRMAEAAVEVEEESAPPVTNAESGLSESAGVNERGLYYGPRERIDLSRSGPYVVERVDELPFEQEQPSAYFSSENRTLYIRKDADPDEVRGYVLQLLSEKVTDGGDKLPDTEELKALFAELKTVGDKVDDIVNKDTQIHVELADRPPRRLRKEVIRDENDRIIGVEEQEVTDGEE